MIQIIICLNWKINNSNKYLRK